jgi:uncharacterized MAPEG superfamily protein
MMDTRFWLLATTGFTACLWIPYVVDRFIRLGIMRGLANPRVSDIDEQSPWAGRARRAHANAAENLVVFTPLALATLHYGLGRTALASSASAGYFVARLTHYAVYTAGVPVLRTLAFAAGFGAQIALLVALANAGGTP